MESVTPDGSCHRQPHFVRNDKKTHAIDQVQTLRKVERGPVAHSPTSKGGDRKREERRETEERQRGSDRHIERTTLLRTLTESNTQPSPARDRVMPSRRSNGVAPKLLFSCAPPRDSMSGFTGSRKTPRPAC